MTVVTSPAIGQAYKGLYHDVDTRYNLCEPPPNLDSSSRVRIEQQARSVACLVDKSRLLETRSNGSLQYSIQSPPVLPLSRQIEANYQSNFIKHCEATATPYDETKPKKCFEGNFGDEFCLGDGTAFLIGKQLVLTAAHCIRDPLTGLVSRIKLTSLLVIFGFQTQSSGQVHGTFDQKDVFHIDAVWNYVYKKNITDWAIVKLDKEVEGRNLLTFANSPKLDVQTQLYMLGHPLGLPLKLTMGAEVKERPKLKKTDEIKEGDEPLLFDADLDAFAGNSGSPVFELEKGTIIAMLFAGNTAQFKSDDKTIQVDQISKEIIKKNGYEKCLNIASISFIKTVLSSSFKMGHTHFAGRMSHLANLKAHLTSLSSSTKVHILYGPGGVGKSELAATFANQNIKNFSFIWSISCGTDEEQWVGYQGLAKRLEVYVDEKEKETLHSLILKVHCKLEQNESKPWLLLFDNLQKSNLPTHPPLPRKGGSIIITSYKSPKICSLPAEAILATEVLPLEFKEALEFLENVTEKSSDDCKTLLTHVGCYPLVLGQVASYIKQTKIEVTEYLTGLQKHQALLVNQGDLSKTSEMTLEAAFNMTLQQLPPFAKQWLFLCSHLNAALIPASYLKAWLHAEGLSEELPAIIAALEEHALLRYNLQEDAFSLHLEFQRILRLLAARDIGAKAAHLLVDMKNEWNFDDTTNWRETMKKATIWASHAETAIETAEGALVDVLEMFLLLDELGRCKFANDHYEQALTYYNKVLRICKGVVGTNPRLVARSLINIGNCYFSLENYSEALKMYSEAFKIQRVDLGEHHPDVAMSLGNIASCYKAQGKYNEALKLYHQILLIFRAVLGENYTYVANTLNNIGICYHSLGNYAEALKAHGESLKIQRAVSGENHPNAAFILYNVGNLYYSQKNYTEALKAYGEALKIRRATMEDNHPDIATNLNDIGGCYFFQGNFAEALKAYGEALKIKRATMEDNHPDIATNLSSIGKCYCSQENYNAALNVYGEVLKIKKATLGENHPDVGTSLTNIGDSYYAQKNYKEALKAYDEALKIKRAVLGENHRNVAISINIIALCYQFQGNYAEALKMYDEGLKIERVAFGENHVTLAMSFTNIASCYKSQKNYNEALKMYNEALKIFRIAFGENHSDVAMTLRNIKECQTLLNPPQPLPDNGICSIS